MVQVRTREPVGQPSGWPAGTSETIQRIYASRGVLTPEEVAYTFQRLVPPDTLGSLDTAVDVILAAIADQKRIHVAGDYDCDGATGTATAVRGLRLLGATNIGFSVPNRFKHGYGLSAALVEEMNPTPDLIITVDSGTSSFEGISLANSKGIQVVVTDHHLPADHLPDAAAIVNPNLDGDLFPAKSTAGVGVMFYVIWACFKRLSQTPEHPANANAKRLAELLDLVAIGTVADLVPLEYNNRVLVAAGLSRIRAGLCGPGLKAMILLAKKDPTRLISQDIAFAIAPRLNAAGRLVDMTVGINVLLAETDIEADGLVLQLEEINDERKSKQADMAEQAETIVENMHGNKAITVFHPDWHSGIVGLVASKVKEQTYRPTFAFAPATPGNPEARGSGRSIPGFHLRDALALVDARHPGLMDKFGGHAMAAGMSIQVSKIPQFSEAFEAVADQMLTEDLLDATLLTDGSLKKDELTLDFAYKLRQMGPWGQGFPEPLFEGKFEIDDYHILAEKHLRLELTNPRTGLGYTAIWFNSYKGEPPPRSVHVVYELNVNSYRGRDSLQLMVRHLEELPNAR